MRLTKNDMARVIVAALYNLPALPAADDIRVVHRAQRGTVARLTRQHKLAVAAIQSTLKHPGAQNDANVALALEADYIDLTPRYPVHA